MLMAEKGKIIAAPLRSFSGYDDERGAFFSPPISAGFDCTSREATEVRFSALSQPGERSDTWCIPNLVR
jgi:hypothetical protein